MRGRNFIWSLVLICIAGIEGCRESQNQEPDVPAIPPITAQGAALIFPVSLRVADESVNIFVEEALRQCATGKYEAFRPLWTAKQEPISRAEFEEGWESVDRIEVRGLQKVLLALEEGKRPEPVYVLLVEVSLDPSRRAGKQKPLREIVLMLIHEHDQWRLAAAPKEMREWIKQRNTPPDATGEPASKNP